MGKSKYTKELLTEAAEQSVSVAGVLTHLGLKQAGGMQAHIATMLRRHEVDTSHFTGQAHGRGKKALNRRTPEMILVLRPEGSLREHGYILRRTMRESGVPEVCECGLGLEWNGKALVLEVDHIDGNWLNNTLSNLRFLCPNCHSQQETNTSWKNKNL